MMNALKIPVCGLIFSGLWLYWGWFNAACADPFAQGMTFYQQKAYLKAQEQWLPLAEKGDIRARFNLALVARKIAAIETKSEVKKGVKEAKNRSAFSDFLSQAQSDGLVDAYWLAMAKSRQAADKPLLSQISPQDWLQQQKKTHYTLQLATGKNRQHLEQMKQALLAKHSLEQADTLYVYELPDQKGRFVLIYGSFASYQKAKERVKQLPDSMQKSSPWIRQFSVLQSIVKE